jgi:hypothetical protein
MPLHVTDPDGDPITFFAQEVDGMDVPTGSEITDHRDGTATFRWPTRPEDAGTYLLRVAAFDEGGGEVFRDVEITIVPRSACTCDCNEDGAVTLDEVVTGIRIALGQVDATACESADADGDGTVGIDELLGGVRYAIDGCVEGERAHYGTSRH